MTGDGIKGGIFVIAAIALVVATLGHMRTVLMVLFDQVQSLDVTGPLEVFTGANTWRTEYGDGPVYDIRTASLGGEMVRTSSGLRVAPDEDLREFQPPCGLTPPGRATRTC